MAKSLNIPEDEYKKHIDKENYEAIREDLAVSEAVDLLVAESQLVDAKKKEKE